MVVFGVLSMLIPAGAGTYLGWQNRNAVVRVHVGHFVWLGHLYGVLIVGALLACWFLLGAAFIQCRIAERRNRPGAPASRYRTRRPRLLNTSV